MDEKLLLLSPQNCLCGKTKNVIYTMRLKNTPSF